MMRHYCSYFDHNYLPRALLLIESLRAQDSAFRLHALCLSDLCVRMLEELALPEVSIVELGAVERRYPELPAVKPARTAMEYIFTVTPFLPSYCLDTVPALDEITYLDSDLYFYADPEPVFAEMGVRSIGIIPHRFSPDRAKFRPFGEFNVGWMTFRATPEGRRCLADYRANCIAWCYDRVEDGRYADQGYLDRWPHDYADVAVIRHKGANVANYNADNYAISERDGGFWCDEQPLVFYHFHGIYRRPDDTYFVDYPAAHFAREDVVIRRLYRPYLGRLLEATRRMQTRFPALAAAPRLGRTGVEIHEAPLAGWVDDRVARVRAAYALARHAPTPARPGEQDAPRLTQFADALERAGSQTGRVSVLDWGGGYGAYAAAARRRFPALAFEWHIVELKAVCDYGAALFDDLAFHDDEAAALTRTYDVVLVIAALHYVPDWRGLFDRLARATRQFLVVTDLPCATGADHLSLTERPIRELPDAVCPGAIIDAPALCALAEAAGLVLDRDLEPWRGPPLELGPVRLTYRSLLFRRMDDAVSGAATSRLGPSSERKLSGLESL